ncbi:MAG: tetratricopeptide repeat protein [Spirochaetes bacterium]|nr:tetratricopeptide repeat protein [Spirochaetota bacterium]
MEDKKKQADDFINQGLSAFYTWEHSKAEEMFLKALELEPENAEIHYQLGSACFYQGRIKESLEYLRKAISLSPDDPHFHLVLGFTLFADNQLKEAAAELECAIEIDGSDIQARKNLGEIYYLIGEYEKSAVNYAFVAENNPYPENYLNYYISLRMSGKEEAALDYLKSSVKNVHQSDNWYLIMRSYLGFITINDVTDKIGEKLMPCLLFYHCGMRCLFEGNHDMARQFFSKCIETKCSYVAEYRRAQHELESGRK